MVRGILERIAAPVRGLHQAAYLLAALTLASQILALVRDRIFAHMFGAGEILDLYYAGFRVPDLVFAIVSSLVSAYVLIPRIMGMEREGVQRLLSECATFLVVVGGMICVALAVGMPSFLTLLYPDLMASSSASDFVFLSRLLLVQPILLGLSGVFASVTQVHRRFVLFAISPVLYNLGIILGTTVLYRVWGLVGIGVGVLIGALAYLLVNIPVMVQAGVFPRFAIPTKEVMLSVVKDSVPRSLALGMSSITLLALTSLASRLGSGAVSVFTFASNLESVPLGLIGASYAVAAFPALSETAAPEKRAAFTAILSASARHVILWSLVSLGLIAVLRAYLVRVILGTGAFDWDATRLTAALLVVLAVGLVAQGLILLFSRALYAIKQSWRPLLYQVMAGVLTLVCASALLALPLQKFLSPLAHFLKVADVEGTAVLAVAVASTLGQLFLMVLSLVALKKAAPELTRTLIEPVVHGSAAAFVGGAAAYAALTLLGGIAPLTTLLTVFTDGLIAGIVGLVASALTLYLLENEEFKIVTGALARLARRKESEAPLPPSGEEPM